MPLSAGRSGLVGPSGAGVQLATAFSRPQPLAETGVAGVVISPAQIGVQAAGQHRVVGVIGVVQHEVASRTEVALDRVGP